MPSRLRTSSTSKKEKQSLVLSTSFTSTRKVDDIHSSPSSPLQSRRSANNVTRMLANVKSEINRLTEELKKAKKRKDDTEKLRDTTGSNIYSGTYSTEHLQKHSIRIRTNTQIRELDKTIKKLENEIQTLTEKYESARRLQAIEKISNSSESITVGDLHVLDSSNFQVNHEHQPALANSIVHNSVGISTSTDSTISTFETESRSRSQTPVNGTVENGTWKISECMQSLNDPSISSDYVLQQSNKLVDLLKEFPELREDLVLTSFLNSIQDLLLRDDKVISSAAYRICRYLVDGQNFIHILFKRHIDIFLIMSLAKDNNNIIEREQAVKLIRLLAEYKTGITKGIVQAVISCVEKLDDNIRTVAIETLLEFCFEHPQLVNECGGMRVLEGLLKDYSLFSIASLILDTILELMATHSTRKYFLDDFNISVLATVFSDFNGKGSINTDKLQNSSALISRAFKNDNGLMLFSVDNFKPIKELLAFIEVPICAQYLLDIFMDVLHIKYHTKQKGRKYAGHVEPSNFFNESSSFNQRLVLIVSILDKCNFIELLSRLIDTPTEGKLKEKLVNKARYLLAEYTNMKNNLIRDGNYSAYKSCAKNDSTVFQKSYKFQKIIQDMNRGRNTLGVKHIDYNEYLRKNSKMVKDSLLIDDGDDLIFRKMVYDTKVLQTKDFTLWNWNVIQELLEGPLMKQKQLEELVRSTKFIRRLLVFYRPLRLRFSDVNQGSRLAEKFIQVGCSFFKMLTTNPEGMKILVDDTKIIPQLASLVFKAIEEGSSSNIFNENSLKVKIIPGYFKFIGVLTQSENGISILLRWNFFTVIYKMFQFDSRIGLKLLLLTLPELDLKYSSHCRNILGRALVVSNENVRMRATKLLGEHLKESLYMHTENTTLTETDMNIERYMFEMITRQLYDLSPNVVAIADQALYEYIAEGDKSQELSSSLRTILNQMVFISSPILFELLSRPYGFHLLNDIRFIEMQRNSWLETKNKEYVDIVEQFLRKTVYMIRSENLDDKFTTTANRLPLHFYESLSRTEDGITLLSQSGDLVKFMNVIKKYVTEGMKNENPSDVLDLKSAMWCCGFIGSTELGIGLLDNYSLVDDILQISYGATVTKVRFTAFYALGLISSTREGCEILDEMGWNCTVDIQYYPVGIALPNRLDKFLSYNEKKWIIQKEYKNEMIRFNKVSGEILGDIIPVKIDLNHLLSEKNIIENTNDENDQVGQLSFSEQNAKPSETLVADVNKEATFLRSRANTISSVLSNGLDSGIIEEIMESISKLGNHILSNAAIKNITDINNKFGPALFEREIMVTKVLDMLDKFRFKPQVRKFLCELFINVRGLENIIKHDRKLQIKPDDSHQVNEVANEISVPSSPFSN
ncbi:similar to Saccharomyces cerevisiae YER093C TSC11 Subunit of TORC2 (Tor2p-Lst8p-Avo1-Avo2-Tsc11p-Bit61p) [Maudiozyma saulgeensis]|uniref:Similar to Saccharomyces cerevisiae YER093C TSC11 Subunit of TORC2 (Tor2p-Lst8p-Avo1-Avo2-Tsc11p-Bit61p) n=1 Tax=Maudiozyma saulgeensis TaxID=1789683 RepID=A0A1X7QXV5_9SACH|nr:similar to Saccharomyces cerevisiae YER093C TSC11 Subunit of TORC2 (Tor2p-Lst8p-Avo1-Avo2-Tsc11p-Bit61p) [Kazachstania saulgeensis]